MTDTVISKNNSQLILTQLRFTAFVAGREKGPEEEFLSFFGAPHAVESQINQKGRRELVSDPSDEYQTLSYSEQKLDFVLNSALTITAEFGSEAMGDFKDLTATAKLEKFLASARNFLKENEKVTRIAVAGNWSGSAESREDAYSKISTLMHHVKVDPEGSSDMLFQINRPRIFETEKENCIINRLSKWNCPRIRFDQKIEGNSPDAPSESISFDVIRFAAETDINTSPSVDFSEFSEGFRLAIFDVMYKFSREIAQEGDK